MIYFLDSLPRFFIIGKTDGNGERSDNKSGCASFFQAQLSEAAPANFKADNNSSLT